jgi:protein subunit release factor B
MRTDEHLRGEGAGGQHAQIAARPVPITMAPTGRVSRCPHEARRSAPTTTASTTITGNAATPTANETAISAQQQPTDVTDYAPVIVIVSTQAGRLPPPMRQRESSR